MPKLNKDQERQIAAAIAELEALGPSGEALGGSVWSKIRDGGLLCRDSLNGRPPTLAEIKLVRTAEAIAVWHPPRPPLEELATDDETRAAVTDWKRRRAAAAAKADSAEAAFVARRDEIFRRLAGSGMVVLDTATQEREGFCELELAATRARVAVTEVARAFADWRLRAWVDGRLKSTKGD